MQQHTDSRWRDSALCRETDPEIFYPEVGQTPHAAKRVCAACPVRAACLTEALDQRDVTFGVRGGMTPNERRELARAQDAITRCERRWAA